MYLFKESHLTCSILTLTLLINVITRGNTLTFQKQKEILQCFFSTFTFYFPEVINFFETQFIVVTSCKISEKSQASFFDKA